MKQIVCAACGYVGRPATRQRGSVWVALVLWVCAVLPGLIYSIWRLTTRYQTCPSCNQGNIFSADSPMAKKFLGERGTNVRGTASDHPRAPGKAGGGASAAVVAEQTGEKAGLAAETAKPQGEGLSARHRPASVENTHDRAILYGRLRTLLLAVFFPVMFGLFLSTYRPDMVPEWISWVLFPIAALCMVGALTFGKKARRHSQPRFIRLESPPGVLFLRPFQEDKDLRMHASWGRDRTLLGDWREPQAILAVLKFEARSMRRTMRTQMGAEIGEILSELTRDFGHLAAIGEPGSPPILGADNVYVPDDGWQDKVLDLARSAKLVILTAGTTPGVLWETENMLRIVPPARLILNIPGMTPGRRRAHYVAFREAAAHFFPRGLPGELEARAITFEDDWSPVADHKRLPPAGTAAHVAWWMSRVFP